MRYRVATRIRSFLRNLFLSRRVEVDLDDEIRSHLEMLTEEHLRAGLSPSAARRAARIDLGGIEQVKEHVRDERSGNWIHHRRRLPLRPAAASEEPGIHVRRGPHARPRHRRDHRHLQRRLRRAAAAAALPRCRTGIMAIFEINLEGHSRRGWPTRTSTTSATRTAASRRSPSTPTTSRPFRARRSRRGRRWRASRPIFSKSFAFSRSSGGTSPPPTRRSAPVRPCSSATATGGSISDRTRISRRRT